MAQFRKKPVMVEAMIYPGHSIAGVNTLMEFEDWFNPRARKALCTEGRYDGQQLVIKTLEGDMHAQPGDWVICGVKGELYPCKPDIFVETYEAVDA